MIIWVTKCRSTWCWKGNFTTTCSSEYVFILMNDSDCFRFFVCLEFFSWKSKSSMNFLKHATAGELIQKAYFFSIEYHKHACIFHLAKCIWLAPDTWHSLIILCPFQFSLSLTPIDEKKAFNLHRNIWPFWLSGSELILAGKWIEKQCIEHHAHSGHDTKQKKYLPQISIETQIEKKIMKNE